jgi:hypothetical protein
MRPVRPVERAERAGPAAAGELAAAGAVPLKLLLPGQSQLDKPSFWQRERRERSVQMEPMASQARAATMDNPESPIIHYGSRSNSTLEYT